MKLARPLAVLGTSFGVGNKLPFSLHNWGEHREGVILHPAESPFLAQSEGENDG